MRQTSPPGLPLGILAVVGILLLAGTSAAEPSTADQTLVGRALAYLDGVRDAKGRFIQTDARGDRTGGEFFLHRPGKARFQYDPPSNLLIVSDGRLVSVLNPRLRSFEKYPLAATPLGLLLAKHIRLEHGVAVAAVHTIQGGFSVTLREGRRAGSLTLDFGEQPMRLLGWSVIDPQGRSTEVRLVGFAPSAALAARWFNLPNPYRSPAPRMGPE